jgi:hypothetical protein
MVIELFETQDRWVQPHALGFGTPSLVSADLSRKYKPIVTTVINDADACRAPHVGGFHCQRLATSCPF